MAAVDYVTETIERAWDLADESTTNADNAVRRLKTATDSYWSFNSGSKPDFQLPDKDLEEIAKLKQIKDEMNKILKDLPTYKDNLFKDLFEKDSGLASVFGPDATWDGIDKLSVIDTLSSAFNGTFNFFGGDGSLSDSYSDTSAFFLAETVYGGGSSVKPAPFGLPDHIVQRLNEQGLAALDREVMRAENDLIAATASRGFPMPSGAINTGIEMIHSKATEQRMEQIGNAYIENYKLAYEATFKYLDLFMAQQRQVQSLFLDYLRAAIDARSGATDDMKFLIDAVVRLRDSLQKFFTMLYDDREILLKQAIAEHDFVVQRENIESGFESNRINAKVSAMSAAASVYGQLASAAVGSQNTMASVAEETLREETE